MSNASEAGDEAARWLERLKQRDLASLTATVRKVQAVAGDEKSSFRELSEVLRHDAALAAKMLRIANSPGYMVNTEPVTTVSRASALIGFDAIRNICITNRLLDALLEEHALPETVQDRLLDRIAASLHAGAQARMLMGGQNTRDKEEAFLAALLDQIGESVLWSLGGPEIEALDAALSQPGADEQAVLREHLGCSFRELSADLVTSWGLGEALEEGAPPALHGNKPSKARVVRLANEIADVVAREGWDSPKLQALQERAAGLMNLREQEAAQRLRACGREAEELASCYGAALLARRMAKKPPRPETGTRAANGRGAGPAPAADSALQLRVLREMSAMIGTTTDINAVIRTAMDGIQRGIGMDRTITALLAPDRKSLQTRLFLGEGSDTWSRAFRFELKPGGNVLHECITGLQTLHYVAAAPGALAGQVPEALLAFCSGHDFVIAPVTVGSRSIGLIYADRALRGEPIGEEAFGSFSHFGQQLGMCLTAITQRRA